jgi:septal ring factor EnvC (AmiA/AmiB activator)
MLSRTLTTLLLLGLAATAPAQDSEGELTKVKEQELEEVRERISELKQSMDAAAEERDRLTGELQEIDIAISEQRMRIADIERDQKYTANKKQKLDQELADREEHLDEESEALAAQVRTAYMTGSQEKIKLLLNQRDPAAVVEQIRKLDELRAQIAAEEARLATLSRARYDELGRLHNSQENRKTLLASLRKRMANEGQEVDRLAAQEKDLTRLIAELTSILSDYPITSEQPFSEHKGKLTWPVAGPLLHDSSGTVLFWALRADARFAPSTMGGSRSPTGWQAWACSSSWITVRAT